MCFFIATPLCYVRRIEKFAFTYLIADILILFTVIVILVYSSIDASDYGFSKETQVFNSDTWLTFVGSAVFSFEGIGVVIPILEVTKEPKKFPMILVMVLLTVLVLYTGFGEYNYFVYGTSLTDPLITSILDDGAFVWVIKILFSVNVIFTYTLMIFPANVIMEGYIFRRMPKSKKRMWLKNLFRTVVVIFTLVVCLLLKNKLDKFLSLIGTLTSTPVSFTIPCIFHLVLCKPNTLHKVIDWIIIGISILIFFICSGFNIWTWND